MQITIDGGDLWSRLMRMAEIGATANGGVNRQAFTELDHQANKLLTDWAAAAGFSAASDAIGNLFIRREGKDVNAAPVLIGSHLDSQPTGGKFDGAAGVLAGFEVLLAFERVQLSTRRPVVCAAWRNEEGSRFQPSCMGSRLFAGEFDLEECLTAKDRDGMSVGEALSAHGAAGQKIETMGFDIAAYLELHIEQGPELERLGIPVGAVTGIQGRRRYQITVRGAESHAGTTPEALRRDALKSAATLIHRLYEGIPPRDERIRFTIGAMEVHPNSPNTVPGRAAFSIDLRHPQGAELADTGARIDEICRHHDSPCQVDVEQISTADPVAFPEAMVELVSRQAEALGHGHMRLASGAGHDAAALAALAPTGMIFVPCRGGLSHNEAEWAEPDHMEAGTAVLAACAAELAEADTR